MKNVVIYCRVSTREQAENGLSLITQQKQCEEYIKKNNLTLVTEPFIEQGESARTVQRTELQKMLQYLFANKGKVDTLLIYKIDRLSRDAADYQSIKSALNKFGVSIHSLTEPIEDNPVGRFIENTMSNIAQLDNEIRGERAKNGTIEALKQGRWVYAAPYGYIQTGGRGKANLILDIKKSPIIRDIFLYIAEGGHTIEDARRFSFNLGLKNNNGKLYNKSSFHRLVKNPIYKGFINIPKMNVYIKGSFPTIIEPKIFDIVQDILKGKNNNPPIYRKIHPDFPLRGTILCPKCNKKMTANWSKKIYPYYKCSTCKNVNLKRKEVHKAFEEFLAQITLSETLVELTKEAVMLNWKDKNKEYSKALNNLQTRQEQIAKEQNAIAEQNRKEILPARVAKEQIDKLEEEYAQINFELSQYTPINKQDKELLEYSTYFLGNICSIWAELNTTSQNELQKFLFPAGLKYDGQKFATVQKSLSEEMNYFIDINKVPRSEQNGTVLQQFIKSLLLLGSILKRLNKVSNYLPINTS